MESKSLLQNRLQTQNSEDSSWVGWERLFPMDYLSYTICCSASSQRWEIIKNPTQLWCPWTRMISSPKYSWRCKSGSHVSTVTKSCINGLMAYSIGGKLGLVLETYPTTWNTEVVGLRGELTTATLVEQHNSEIHSKCLSLYQQVSLAPTPLQRSCFLLQMETITGNWLMKYHYRHHQSPTC